MSTAKPRVVIVGAGFGGLAAAKALARAPAEIIVIDRRNYHLFQPLLYQVATAALRRPTSPGRSAASCAARRTHGAAGPGRRRRSRAPRGASSRTAGSAYDYLVLATGARHSYFGHDDWEEAAPGLKKIADATRSASASCSRSSAPRSTTTRRERRRAADLRRHRRRPDRGRDGGRRRRTRRHGAGRAISAASTRTTRGSCWSRRGPACCPPSRRTCRRSGRGQLRGSASRSGSARPSPPAMPTASIVGDERIEAAR